MIEKANQVKVAELQNRRGRSRQDFFKYQLEGARGSFDEMRKYFDSDGKEILDVGCGLGGNSVYFLLMGSK